MDSLEKLGALSDVTMTVRAELSCAPLSLEALLLLKPGSLLRAERAAGDSIDVRVGDELIGSGEVIVIGSKLGIRLSEFVERI